MSIFGVSMVRDEQDVIAWSLPRMAAQLDEVIVADNCSTDDTYEMLHDIARQMGNITVVSDTEPAYMQSAKMTALAEMAEDQGGDVVVPFDADEVWVAPKDLASYVADVIQSSDAHVLEARLYDHVATAKDPEEPDVCKRIGYRRFEPLRLPKVCARILPGLVIEQGNHGAHYPGPHRQVGAEIDIRHYPYRTAEQMARKARNGKMAYEAAGNRLPRDTGRHWREYGEHYERGGMDAIREIFTTWFWSDDPDADGLVYDPCPIAMP